MSRSAFTVHFPTVKVTSGRVSCGRFCTNYWSKKSTASYIIILYCPSGDNDKTSSENYSQYEIIERVALNRTQSIASMQWKEDNWLLVVADHFMWIQKCSQHTMWEIHLCRAIKSLSDMSLHFIRPSQQEHKYSVYAIISHHANVLKLKIDNSCLGIVLKIHSTSDFSFSVHRFYANKQSLFWNAHLCT